MRPLLRREQAQSLVEFALLLPFLLLLLLGTVEIGRSFRTYITLTNAAREGAVWLTRHPSDSAGARTLVTGSGARRPDRQPAHDHDYTCTKHLSSRRQCDGAGCQHLPAVVWCADANSDHFVQHPGDYACAL